MAANPVAEDTSDRFTGTRKRLSHPINFGSTFTIFQSKTVFTLGFLESGDSSQLYIHIQSDAEGWRFYQVLWVIAGGERFQLDLTSLRSDTYPDGAIVRCQEQFSASPIDQDLLRQMLTAPSWEVRLSGRTTFEEVLQQHQLDLWRAFYNAVVDPEVFKDAAARATPSSAGCLPMLIGLVASGSLIAYSFTNAH